jgi:hypothetical protein
MTDQPTDLVQGTRDVFSIVVGQGLSLTFAGLAIGVTAALILTRLLLSFSHSSMELARATP